MKAWSRAAAATCLTVVAIVVMTQPAVAMSGRRLVAAACMLRLTENTPFSGRTDDQLPDLEGVTQCLDQAGDPLHTTSGRLVASIPDLQSTAVPVQRWHGGPPDGPVPADLVFYIDRTVSPRWRVAMLIGDGEAVAWFRDERRVLGFHRVPLAEIMNAAQRFDGGDPIHPDAAAMDLMRIDSGLWPGSGDVRHGPGRVALVDPQVMDNRMLWSVDHPRDADTSVWHALTLPILSALSAVSAVLQAALGLALEGIRLLLEHFGGAPGATVLAAAALLSQKFDGTWLHRGLTLLLLALINPTLALAVVVCQLPTARGVPILGAILGVVAGVLWNVTSYVVTLATGIDEGQTSVTSMLFALVTMPFLWARGGLTLARIALAHERLVPWGAHLVTSWAAVTARLAPLSEMAWRVVRPVAGAGLHAADVIALRPSNLIAGWERMRAGDAVRTPASTAGSVSHSREATLRTAARHAADIATLPLRPGAPTGELLGQLRDGAGWVTRGVRSTGRGWPFDAFHRWMQWLPARAQEAVDARAVAIQTGALPLLHDLSRASGAHHGAVAIGDALGGRPPEGIESPDRRVYQPVNPAPLPH